MTIAQSKLRSELARLADFFDGRTNGGPKPKITITRPQLDEIRHNPKACGCEYISPGQYRYRLYELELK